MHFFDILDLQSQLHQWARRAGSCLWRLGMAGYPEPVLRPCGSQASFLPLGQSPAHCPLSSAQRWPGVQSSGPCAEGSCWRFGLALACSESAHTCTHVHTGVRTCVQVRRSPRSSWRSCNLFDTRQQGGYMPFHSMRWITQNKQSVSLC